MGFILPSVCVFMLELLFIFSSLKSGSGAMIDIFCKSHQGWSKIYLELTLELLQALSEDIIDL